MKKSSIKSIVIAITYKCNSRCKMCNIWQNQDKNDINPNNLCNLKHLKYINISGGEPFLHSNLEEVIKILKQNNKNAELIISSNGYAADIIIEKTRNILKIDPKIGIRISIDGLEEAHNKIRNVENIFQNAIKTIKQLKNLGIKNLGIAFTIMDDNIQDLFSVYKLSKEIQVDFSLSAVVNSDIYFQTKNNNLNVSQELKNQLEKIIKEQLISFNIKKWLKAYFNFALLSYIITKKRLLKSDSGYNSLFVDINENIYISNMSDFCISNLKNIDLNKINALKIKKHKNNKEEPWSICNSRISMRKNIHKIIFWIIINKIKAHLI